MITDFKLLVIYALLAVLTMWSIIDRNIIKNECETEIKNYQDSINSMVDQMHDMQYELDVQYDALRRYEDIFYEGVDPTVE